MVLYNYLCVKTKKIFQSSIPQIFQPHRGLYPYSFGGAGHSGSLSTFLNSNFTCLGSYIVLIPQQTRWQSNYSQHLLAAIYVHETGIIPFPLD